MEMFSFISSTFFLFFMVFFFALFHLFHQWFMQLTPFRRFPPLRLFVEIALVLITAMVMDEVFLLRSISPKSAMFGYIESIKPDLFHGTDAIIAHFMILLPFMLLFLGLSRWKYLAVALIPLLTLFLYAHQYEVAAFNAEIPDPTDYPEAVGQLFQFKCWLSVTQYIAMLFVFRVAPFVVAMLFMGKTFSKVRYVSLVAGAYVVIAAIYSMNDPHMNISVLTFQGAAMFSMALLFFELPYLHECVKRIVCPTDGEKGKRDVGFLLFKGAQAGFVVLLAVCLIGFVQINREGKKLANRTKNFESLDYPADQVDGLTMIDGTVFSPSVSSEMVYIDYNLSDICYNQTYQELEKKIASLDRQAVDKLMDEQKDSIALFEKIANEADYFGPVRVDGNLRIQTMAMDKISGVIAIRSMVRGVDGDLEGALSDVQAIYAMCGLFHDNYMGDTYISSNLQTQANNLIWNLIVYHQGDPDKLAMIAKVLKNLEPITRPDFPVDKVIQYHRLGDQNLSIGEHALNDGMMLLSAYRLSNLSIVFYDQLVLTTALLRYKHEHGKWAEKADLLVPDYLDQIITEPLKGTSYVYDYGEDGVTVKITMENGQAVDGFYPFPISGDLEVEKTRTKKNPLSALIPGYDGNL